MKGGERLARAFRRAAEAHPRDEAGFRAEAEHALLEVASEHRVQLEPQLEVTLATGIADAVFNRMIIEWEPPGGMAASPGHRGNVHAVQQVRNYVDGLAARERRTVERLSGVASDGHWMIFCRYRAGRWTVDDPVPVDENSAAQLLRTLLAAQTGRALIAENLLRDFSADALLTRQLARELLVQLDFELDQRPDGLPARLFRQWEVLFAVATGVTGEGRKPLEAEARRALERVAGVGAGTDPSRTLFCLQTYFAIVTKLIASLSLSFFVKDVKWNLAEIAQGGDVELLEDMDRLHRGVPFAEAGLTNALEPDVFGWYLFDWRPGVRNLVREGVKRLKEYDPTTLQVSPEDTRDLLKDLYQGLLPRPLRHALGQYFTPDWLAGLLLDRLDYNGDPNTRIVDPACGTGTFLVLAIARLLERLRHEAIDEERMLEIVTCNVVGFDIDPLATLASRTNYVLALGPLVSAAKGRGLDVPVYRADSMIGPTLKQLSTGDKLVLDTQVGRFSLPACVDTDAELRAVCDLAVEGLDGGWSDPEYARRAGDACAANEDQRTILADFFNRCREVHTEALDGLWPRLLRNAFMPAFIERFDLVVGNPPWVSWEHLPGSYRERTRHLWQDSGLFTHVGMTSILGATTNTSMLMSYVVTDRLLVEKGRLGFVVPQTLFKTVRGGQGFRAFKIGKDGPSLQIEGVDDMVDLNPFVGAANRTALMTWRRDVQTLYPVAYRVWQRRTARGIPEDSTVDDVYERTRRLNLVAAPVSVNDWTSAWLASPAELIPALRNLAETGEPAYEAHKGVYASANGVYWLTVDGPPDAHGRLPVANIHDAGRRRVPRRYGQIEKELVHPLVRGSEVTRWHAESSLHILLVHGPGVHRWIDEATMRECYPGAFEFLGQFAEVLRSAATYKRYFASGANGAPYWSMFNVGPYTFAKHKVVWKEQAAEFAAAVMSSPGDTPLPIPNHKVILVACESEEEAHFICGALNSAPVRCFVACYTVETQITTHPIKYIRVPRFDGADPVHERLATASRDAHEAAARGERPDENAVDLAASALWGLAKSDIAMIRLTLDQLRKRDLRRE